MSSVQVSTTTRDADAALRLQPTAADGASAMANAGDDVDAIASSSRTSGTNNNGRNGRDMAMLDTYLEFSVLVRSSVIYVLQFCKDTMG